MPTYTSEQYADLLTRALTAGKPPQDRPRAVFDTDNRGETILEFTLPNPHDPRRSVSLTAVCRRGVVTRCALWFGQAEITAALRPEEAVPAIEEITAGRIVAIVRYKTRDAYDSRRKAGSGFIQKLYQLPDDETALSAMLEKLRKPAGWTERLTANQTGVFEIYRWESSETLER